MWSSDTAQVFFDDVRVPCTNIIGEEGMGFTYQMLQFQEERLWAVANSERTVLNNQSLDVIALRLLCGFCFYHHFIFFLGILSVDVKTSNSK